MFVTLDPLRDTPKLLGDYMKSFNLRLNTAGKYVGYFPPGTSGKRMSEQVRALLPVASP